MTPAEADRPANRRTGAAGAARPPVLPPLLLLLLLLAGIASPLAAQETARAAGRVVRPGGADSAPVSGVPVTLHRVGREVQGPVDSMRTDAAGRFEFRFVPDTTALYILSARHQGIEYISEPVHTNPARPDTTILIAVSDTAAGAPVATGSRHVVVSRPGEDASRRVLDLLGIVNPGLRTRVARDSAAPTWSTPIPADAIGFSVGESDFAPDVVVRDGGRVLLYGPIAPGAKQLLLQYALPGDARTVALPVTDSTPLLNVLLEEPDAAAEGAGLALADTQVIDGRPFRRWVGVAAPGDTIRIRFSGAARATDRWVLAGLLGAMAAAMLAAAVIWRRRRATAPSAPHAPGEPVGEDPVPGLLDAVAELDRRYAGKEERVPPEEWTRYQAERARLKAALAGALASRPRAM